MVIFTVFITQIKQMLQELLKEQLYQKNLYREKIVYDEEANNFYNIIEPDYKCYDKDYEKKKPKQHNSRFCKLCKGTGWIIWTARNNQLIKSTQCHQCQ